VKGGQQAQEHGLRVLARQDVRQAHAEQQQVPHHHTERRQHRPMLQQPEHHRGDDHGHAHVGGVGPEMHRHQQAWRVVQVELRERQADLVAEADLAQPAALGQGEGGFHGGEEGGQPRQEQHEQQL
jgi:hypothetical protein